MADPRFLPPEGENFYSIALLNGHGITIYRTDPSDGKPGTPLPAKFRKAATLAECYPVGADIPQDEQEDGETRVDIVARAIAKIIERDEAEELDNEGKPTREAVKKEAGFNLVKGEYDKGFAQFEASLK